jgi:hypothetical protein
MTDRYRTETSRRLTLRQYVLARNGVPMGGSRSLRNMLLRSLGAPSFAGFWRYWNPIWGYYLGRYVYRPGRRHLPRAGAVVLTFLVSGAIHDIAVMVVHRSRFVLFTPWFFAMSLAVLAGEALGVDLSRRPWVMRAAFNLAIAGGCLWLVLLVRAA